MDIQVTDLSKIYSGNVSALNGVSFHIDHNGTFALIGKNGAGKTTLVRILSTQLMPTSGRAFINGSDVVQDAREVREIIAAVPQEARAVPWMTPMQTITSYLMWRGYTHSESRTMARDVLRSLGLEDQENLKNRSLSGGQKRKVLVATALASEAKVIFMDEPTTGLDFISRKELWDVLAGMKKDRLIILTTHYLEEAEQLGDRIGIIDHGRMVDMGTLEELRGLTRYPLSLKIFARNLELPDVTGQVRRLADGEIQVLTTEDQAYGLVTSLLASHIRFNVQEISLNTIFESLVQGGANGE